MINVKKGLKPLKFALGLISWKNEKMADKIKKERIWLFCEVFELLNLKKEIVFCCAAQQNIGKTH
ncbi:hypothetical protein [Leptospira borgpetersenii]|uniref:Uncharacterized protein n=2 Tax=Leptospira TaxID=171 RepID=A0AA40WER2_LEPIR|nr:hypothetical protein [Leptospira borgpetersenii]MBE8431924.1 hypothetical protein [Leptospira interrogans serovar Pomona]MBE8366305.1 hypothetical protein [Leptospira borgpetersenii serovar Balcanica]MBE8414136.1 hypothetical protein [Leptospira borgpetersenii serovar Tarassovi]MBE8417435.1 hypothetical protein [Leptospira borgpetersenii serovar Tarassovi]MBE8433226.1 hypothetical protein [Leptospira borgpetersenii serovar Tarassovi]